MKIVLQLPLCLLLSKSLNCERRITNGSMVGSDVNSGFVVYLIAAQKYVSKPVWPGWICSGTIIHPIFIITSAACLVDVQNIYVISGYRRYVKPHLIQNDKCINHTKRKIVSYCTRATVVKGTDELKPYVTNSTGHDWTYLDLAIAKVKPTFDFYDQYYVKYCSYLPVAISINYNRKYDQPGQNVVVYGWGHAQYARPVGDLKDYNEEYLRWSHSTIMNLDDCKAVFSHNKAFEKVNQTLNTVGICTSGDGSFDASGSLVKKIQALANGCQESRREGNKESNTNCTYISVNSSDTENVNTRRNGVCQNDHGSPLVTWIGGKPHLVGVATFFLVKNNMQCVGPYVYTSTRPNSKFISCLMEVADSGNLARRKATRTKCDDEIDFQLMRKNLTDNDDDDISDETDREDVKVFRDLDKLSDLDEYISSDDNDNLSELRILNDYDLE